MAFGALTTKLVAVFAGPAGIGTYSQLRQIAQWLVVLATLNGQNSLVRGISGRATNEQRRFVMVVAVAYIVGAAVAACAILILAPNISQLLFASNEENLITAIRAVAIPVIFGVAASFVIALINGYRDLALLGVTQIVGSILTVLAAYPMVLWGKPVAYVLLVASGFVAVSAYGGWGIVRRGWLNDRIPTESNILGDNSLRDHVSYSAASLVAGLIGAGAVLAIRTIYIRQGGLQGAGLFDAAWTLSMTYVTLLLSSFGTYYFPTLSGKRTRQEIQKCVSQIFHISTVLGTLLVSLIIVTKPLLVSFLYSQEFVTSTRILRWMLVGDYLKINTFVFGMLLLAFAERRRFLISEILWHGFMVLSVITLIVHTHEIVGIAFVIGNACYVVYLWRHAFQEYGVVINAHLVRAWILGLLVVVALSVVTWNNSSRGVILPLGLWLITSISYVMTVTSSRERRVLRAWVRNWCLKWRK
jgi:O-antigen/teichoic acid export membrane protein